MLRPAYGLLFGMPGVPAVYYGSEWSLSLIHICRLRARNLF